MHFMWFPSNLKYDRMMAPLTLNFLMKVGNPNCLCRPCFYHQTANKNAEHINNILSACTFLPRK